MTGEARSACQRPCAECPWRTDVPTGRFPPERYVGLAHTAYDGDMTLFACHKSSEGRDVACAGFLMVGAEHNFGVRLGRMDGHYSDVTDGGHTLHASFREMAEANGVPPDSPALERCRD